eukprot:TRINITY_DN22922_c0_g1_i1.p1 TRINITY_DN22922_c0_g1~~TRINITY_DN22922_c0_g1_i1.p1  ORF type:complete len:281 (+),score=52.08 TRINITY_DN22922_c0_g1_i1:87-845(+)
MNEEVGLELEALSFTYSDILEIQNDQNLIINVNLKPRVEKEQEIFVMIKIAFFVGDDYPRSPPKIKIESFKGLSDEEVTDFEKILSSEAEENQGDLILGQLIELAMDELDRLNLPKGRCCFCLEDMVDQSGHAEKRLIRMPCFHTFHFDCFLEWWEWQQVLLRSKEFQVVKELGSYEYARIQNKLPTKEGEIYDSFCPVCRLALPLSQIPYNSEFILTEKHVAGNQNNAVVIDGGVDIGNYIDMQAQETQQS